jgi:hypothetical protein
VRQSSYRHTSPPASCDMPAAAKKQYSGLPEPVNRHSDFFYALWCPYKVHWDLPSWWLFPPLNSLRNGWGAEIKRCWPPKLRQNPVNPANSAFSERMLFFDKIIHAHHSTLLACILTIQDIPGLGSAFGVLLCLAFWAFTDVFLRHRSLQWRF